MRYFNFFKNTRVMEDENKDSPVQVVKSENPIKNYCGSTDRETEENIKNHCNFTNRESEEIEKNHCNFTNRESEEIEKNYTPSTSSEREEGIYCISKEKEEITFKETEEIPFKVRKLEEGLSIKEYNTIAAALATAINENGKPIEERKRDEEFPLCGDSMPSNYNEVNIPFHIKCQIVTCGANAMPYGILCSPHNVALEKIWGKNIEKFKQLFHCPTCNIFSPLFKTEEAHPKCFQCRQRRTQKIKRLLKK